MRCSNFIKKQLLSLCFLFVVNLSLNAQENKKVNPNNLSVEIGKNGFILNLTYDRVFQENKIGMRAFGGSNFDPYLNAKNFGVGGYYLKELSSNYLELGLDLGYLAVDEISDDQKTGSILFIEDPLETYLLNFNIGYRIISKSTIFRVGASPSIIKTGFIPGAYLSFGFRF